MQQTINSSSPAYWLVGAVFGGHDDQFPRFLDEGIWENGYADRYLDTVRQMKPGDRIAIKSSYTRKHNLPFENRGHKVSAMAIKAIGTITENLGDGRRVKVDWKPLDSPREWYFYTGRRTIWRLKPGSWMADGLSAFVFDEKPQDLERFRNARHWRSRFGDSPEMDQRFAWTSFYEELAGNLRAYRAKRSELTEALGAISSRVTAMGHLDDHFKDGTIGFARDICPFTTLAVFNRNLTVPNRRAIAQELAAFLQVKAPAPESYEGIPLMPNFNSWFYEYEKDRSPDDIERLWDVFEAALDLDDKREDADDRFLAAFDAASAVKNVAWNLTMGLFWIRPWDFPSLDETSRKYLEGSLGITVPKNGPGGRCSGSDYLQLLDTLEERFEEEAFPVHSFPELSLKAYQVLGKPQPVEPSSAEATSVISSGYSLDQLIEDGCFVPRAELEVMLGRLRNKKNLILQGPPGTGKTWLARRLAFALLGTRDERRVRAVQFHPTLSYEDFVRGYRPSKDGKLDLVDGVFLDMVTAAQAEPERDFVLVIEEINRGNPAQIFGELLTLIEADKRHPDEALELSYRRYEGERIHVPANLHVIGTMNIADRSLALVDMALRRRFAFFTLQPRMEQEWRKWLVSRCGIDKAIVSEIQTRVRALNDQIANDAALGPQFAIGHSYVTPMKGSSIPDARAWFHQVVETEIGPLLDEYWFDAPKSANKARQQLLEGF